MEVEGKGEYAPTKLVPMDEGERERFEQKPMGVKSYEREMLW
jgi:hypothetical protein